MNALIMPEIEAYAEAHSSAESEACRALREETCRRMELPQMMVGPLEAAFLKMMVGLLGARRVLEVGMFTGYSALSFAEALPDGGQVITCEIDHTAAAVARRYFAKSSHGHKIDIRMGPALDTLQGLHGPFDLIFIDADKTNYLDYYRRAVEFLSPDGAILIDNVLWSGAVLLQPPPDRSTEAIQELNRIVASDPRVSAVLLTIRDGIFLIRLRQSPHKNS